MDLNIFKVFQSFAIIVKIFFLNCISGLNLGNEDNRNKGQYGKAKRTLTLVSKSLGVESGLHHSQAG